MANWLLDPLGFEFMRLAIALSVPLGILCAVVGSYLIVQQMGMMGDVIAHSVLPGLSIAFFLGLNLATGAFVAGTLSALFVAWIHSQSHIKVDVAMALVLSSFLALGITFIKLLRTNKLDLDQILFGDILGVTPGDFWSTLGITGVVLVLVKLFYKELLFYTFDALGAQASGLPVAWLYGGLIAAITLTVITSMHIVGVLLVISLLIGPAATAYLLVTELHWMMVWGSGISIAASVSGMYLSYYWDIPSGPAIVLVVFGLFLMALLFSPSQGILTRPAMTDRLLWRSLRIK